MDEHLAAVQDDIDAYWTGRSRTYDAYQQRPDRSEENRQTWTTIFRDALPDPPARVLDVGTGSGYVAMLLADAGYSVVAVDRSAGMLEFARRHAAGRSDPPVIVAGDAVDPPGEPESFDAVTNRYLMWTLRQPVAALEAWRRLLRPGGVLAVVDSTWFAHGPVRTDQPFGTHYGPDVWDALPLSTATSIDATAELVRHAGYTDVTVTPLTTILELDRRHGVAPNHDVQLQYLVTGRAPST